jgi:hypothetical protein
MMVRNGDQPRKTDGLLDRRLGDDIVVLSPDGKVLHTFSDSACFIWKRIDGEHTVEEIVSEIMDEYGVEAETARSDMSAFLAELANLGLIKQGA